MEIARFPSRGGFSVRSIFAYALAALTTVILWMLVAATPVHAQEAEEPTQSAASWNGASLQYQGKQYLSMGEVKPESGLTITEGSPYYVYIEEPAAGQDAPTLQKAHVIYFAPGADPPTEEDASYLVYDYDASTRTFSNPTAPQAIVIDSSTATSTGTACAVEQVGWAVCPIADFLAGGMDYIFHLLSGFMEVQPIHTNNPQGGLYIAWNVMRAVANVAFIIVFLIIIYSQLTSIQVSNYGIKRLLPRMIIAAIGVNISFIICALAIDLSNIIGYSLHGIFMELRNDLIANGAPTGGAEVLSWESITGFVLSGGTAALAGVVGVGAAVIGTGGTVMGAIFLLLPALLGLILAVLVVLLILAARQALIVILVIIAPLAIVAYLLPNTEKWFDKWRGLFLTLLVFFPAFAVVFGGAQLAGAVIIQNASSINMIILGMIVQVAPLVITPLLLKFSGSLIGGIARLVNNPNKGLVDRTRNWSKSHADWHRDRGRGGLDKNGNPRKIYDKDGKEIAGGLRKRNFARQTSRYLDQRKRRRTDRTGNGEMATQTAYENSRRYAKYDKKTGELTGGVVIQKATLEARRDQSHSHHAADIDKARRTQGSMIYQAGVDAESYKKRAEASQNYTAAFYNNASRDKKLAGGALHASSYQLELSKAKLETTENLKTAYYNEQRTTKGTDLYASVKPLETSKLRVETAQNDYTAMVETMKTAGGNSKISVAAQRAQSSKEHLETAQNQLQAFFDTQRKDPTSMLGTSTIKLEESKSVAEGAKAELTTYITQQRTQKNGALRQVTLETERVKGEQQIAETQLTKMVEEFKSGKIKNRNLNAGERQIMEDMKADSIILAAEKQAVNSAQYEVQRNIADVMTGQAGNQPLTDQMLKIAQGVGGDTARVRAVSQAVNAARGLDADALKSNVELLKDEARRSGTNIKYYSKEMVERFGDGYTTMPDGSIITPERLKAALQAQAEEKNIPLFEDVRGNARFDQAMVSEIVSLNSGPYKAAGAFAMQDKLSRNIDNFASKEEYEHALSLDHISNLANANASGLAGWKMGQIVKMAKPEVLKADIEASLAEIRKGEAPGASDEDKSAAAEARANLTTAYDTVREALENDDIRAGIKDREVYVRRIEAALARLHGQEPLKAEPRVVRTDVADVSSLIDTPTPEEDDTEENS